MVFLSTAAKFVAGSVSFIVLALAILISMLGSCPNCQRAFFTNFLRMRDPTKKSQFNEDIVCPHLLRGDSGRELSGVVVEVGSGAGASLACYANASKIERLVLVEPLREFREDLERNVKFFGLEGKTEIITAGGETLSQHIKAADFVTSLHLLCSVPEDVLEKLLSEVAKILKPGGEYRPVDHRLAPKGDWRRVVQEFLRVPWGVVGNGCRFVDFEEVYPAMFASAADGKPALEVTSIVPFDYAVIKFLPIIHPHIRGVFTRPGGKQ